MDLRRKSFGYPGMSNQWILQLSVQLLLLSFSLLGRTEAQDVDCGPLNAPANGNLRLEENRTSIGAVVTYTCKENYTISGNANRTCREDGKWSGEEPECLFDWCPMPPEVSGAKVETNGRRAGSIATYSCMHGFTLIGHSVLSCKYGGEWQGKIPTCKYVDCGFPPHIQNGKFRRLNGTSQGTTTAGSIVEYYCDEDYRLSRDDNIQICSQDGKWSGKTPSCELITCEAPKDPNGGYVVIDSNKVNSTIKYHCHPGHILHGDQTSICSKDGKWSGNVANCEYVDCGKLPPLPNGAITYKNGTTHLGSEMSYSCLKNYRLAAASSNGIRRGAINPKRYCQENHQWSGISPRCEEIRCTEPALPAHLILSVNGNNKANGRTLIRSTGNARTPSTQTYHIGASIKFHCEKGYKIVGDTLGTCKDTGQWSVKIPQCDYVDCGNPEQIENGNVTLVSNATYYGVVALYECIENYQVIGHGKRLCLEKGTWSSEAPVCKEIKCGEPETDSTTTANISSYGVSGIATYSCKSRGMLEGNATRICMKNGIWSGKMPSCTLIDCQHPGLIKKGRVVFMNGTTTYESLVKYYCLPKCKRSGTSLRYCMENGQWSGDAPKCEQCTSEEKPQLEALLIGVCGGAVFMMITILGLIYIRLRKVTPVKNTEKSGEKERKESQSTAVKSSASLSDGSNGTKCYENVIENDELGSNGPTYEAANDSPNHDWTLGHQGDMESGTISTETDPKANENTTVIVNGEPVH